jgi:hypothetical protein
MHICERCGYNTKFLGNLKLHLIKKKECNPILCNSTQKELFNKLFRQSKDEAIYRYKCEKCDKIFMTRQGKCKHKKNCTVNKQKKEIEELKNKVFEMKKEKNQNTFLNNIHFTGNNNTISDCNNTNYNIQINAFGKENVSYIKDNLFNVLSYIKKNEEGVLNFIEDKHFNKNYPENHNIKKTNKKDKCIQCYDGNIWKPNQQDKVIGTLMKELEIICNEALKMQDASMNDVSMDKKTQKKFITNTDFQTFMYKVGCPMDISLQSNCNNLTCDEQEEGRDPIEEELRIKKALTNLIIEYIQTRSKTINF